NPNSLDFESLTAVAANTVCPKRKTVVQLAISGATYRSLGQRTADFGVRAEDCRSFELCSGGASFCAACACSAPSLFNEVGDTVSSGRFGKGDSLSRIPGRSRSTR